jgi:hypothetical protein
MVIFRQLHDIFAAKKSKVQLEFRANDGERNEKSISNCSELRDSVARLDILSHSYIIISVTPYLANKNTID